MMGPWYGWGGWVMVAVMVIFWGLVIWGIVYLIQRLSLQRADHLDGSRTESALEILKKRYARGEINKEEFDTKKKDLT